MSSPRVAVALWATFVRSAATRARLLSFALVAGLVVAVAATARGAGTLAASSGVDLADLAVISFVAPVTALIFGVATFGDLVDDGTLVYLWLRPVRRGLLGCSAHAASLTLCLPVAVGIVMASQLVAGASMAVTAAAIVAAVAATTAYSCWFTLLGLLSRRALVWGVAWVLIVDQFVARGSRSLGAISVRAHAMSILAGRSGVESPVAWFSPRTSVVVLAAVCLAAVTATAVALRRAEVA